MRFLCTPFPHLCLICQPVCVCIYIHIDFSAAALGHCSVSSPSYLSLKLPLQRGSLGQDRSCQHPGALGKDASMGGQETEGEHTLTPCCWKRVGFSGMWMSLHFHFTQEIQRGDNYWIIHKLFNIPVRKKQCFFWKYAVEESEKDLWN